VTSDRVMRSLADLLLSCSLVPSVRAFYSTLFAIAANCMNDVPS